MSSSNICVFLETKIMPLFVFVTTSPSSDAVSVCSSSSALIASSFSVTECHFETALSLFHAKIEGTTPVLSRFFTEYGFTKSSVTKCSPHILVC